MIKLFITIIFDFVFNFLNVITYPISLLFTNIFPNASDFITNIISFYDTYLYPYVNWCLNLIPLNILNALLISFNIHLMINWTIVPAYENIVKGLRILKKLPFL